MAGTKPNDLPCMYLNEIRNVGFTWLAESGTTIESVTYSCPTSGITFDDSEEDGLNSIVPVTAAQAGCHTILATAVLTNGETKTLKAHLTISDPTLSSGTRDYE